MIQRLAASAPLRWRLHSSIAPELWDAIYESVHRNDRQLLEALLMVDIQPPPEITMQQNRAPGMARFETKRDQLASVHIYVASRYAVQRGHADIGTLLDAALGADDAPLGRANRLVMTNHEEKVHFMMIAARLETAEFLAEHFADAPANSRDRAGQTALIHAARTGNTAACRWLIDNGADPNILDKDIVSSFRQVMQSSPLHHAVELGHDTVVKTLLEAGAEANLQPSLYSPHLSTFTLLDRAVLLGHHGIVALLLDAGSKLNLPSPRRLLTYTLEVAAGTAHAETMLPLLYTDGVLEGRITPERLVALTATNPARLFGLYPRKGVIAAGSDADIVIYDPAVEQTLSVDTHHMNVDYSAYEGMRITGKVRTVLSRGTVVVDNDTFHGQLGHGAFLHRDLNQYLT
jgi:hypothetical protein